MNVTLTFLVMTLLWAFAAGVIAGWFIGQMVVMQRVIEEIRKEKK